MRNETIAPDKYDVYQETPEQVLERYSRHVNHRFATVIKLIGFDRVFTKARGAWARTAIATSLSEVMPSLTMKAPT